MIPTIGRVVHYTLSEDDVIQINRRRTNSQSILERIKTGIWPIGAQAHIGNEHKEGQIVPMIIVNIWSDTCVNGQALLDGNDTFWVLSATLGTGESRTWSWPVIK